MNTYCLLSRLSSVLSSILRTAPAVRFILVCALATALALAATGTCFAVNTGCAVVGSDGNCPDVPTDGISYTSGVTTVNVGDGTPGAAVVNSGVIGIELSQSGVSGGGASNPTFQTIPWDTDGTAATPPVDVVSQDGTIPFMAGTDYILVETYSGGSPDTFRIGATIYTGTQLVQYLAANSSSGGAAITGSLTVNNNQGPLGQGASFGTTNAGGIAASSTGGRGGNGGCFTLLVWSWCDDGYRGGDAGSVAVNSNSTITVSGTAEGKHGVSAISQGGNGGDGGGWFGLFGSTPGGGGNGGNGAAVFVTLGAASDITTNSPKSHGVFAQSRGGDGGGGGDASGAIALGSDGGYGGDAGNVTVINAGSIHTLGADSHGIYARSVGAGAGAGSWSGGIYAQGGNGGGESSGAMVTVNNSGTIITGSDDSFGIYAQSVGGGGGDGGDTGGLFTVGGRAGSGGGSNVVTVHDSGTVRTAGDRSTAIFAESIGGGGGNGGDAISISPTVSVAVGGQGGLGGNGHDVFVTADGSDIDTAGDLSRGIQAQSVGGGGGNGGLAVSGAIPVGSGINVSIAVGGNGGNGGSAGETVQVVTTAATDIDTLGSGAHGIFAQSLGGGGGSGGAAISATGGSGLNIAVGVGGKGGVAGNGQDVTVNNAGTITTSGSLSNGIFAQSVGGGGGSGGFAGTLAIGAGSASIGIGGGAGGGGTSGLVDVTNSGAIHTGGDNAAGIIAQSVGGGGGSGGSALSGSGGVMALATAIGGSGGDGNNSGEVRVTNSGDITTAGSMSYGIYGHSIGGGGGSGGFALSGALAISVEGVPAGSAAISIGGHGGGASSGGTVTVDINGGSIETMGLGAHAVYAQSVGGGGGDGGFAGSLAITAGTGGSFGVAIGGGAANGGDAGTVQVTSDGASIITHEDGADGIHAQSVGGGGGDGGFAFSGAAGFGGEKNISVSVAIGGGGGAGGEGNTVDVGNSAAITTYGDQASAIFAESVGGGGGNGGLAVSGTLGLSPTTGNVGVSVGGGGGDGNISRNVTITNSGALSTYGRESYGIFGQSVGGSGGNGGMSITAQLTGTTNMSATVGVSVGGGGGTGNAAGDVSITNASGGTIHTEGTDAHGVYAQSVGGGGGNGGMSIIAQLGKAGGTAEQASKTLNVGVSVGGAAGSGGTGGSVAVTNSGAIEVLGDSATGIYAQSVGGGGGNGGGTINGIGMLTDSTNSDSRALGVTVAVGGNGGSGNHGDSVDVTNTGSILTHGGSGYGIFAQSVGGGGGIGGRANTIALIITDKCTLPVLCTAPASTKNNLQLGATVGGNGMGGGNGGSVTVTNSGAIETLSDTADGIYAQSVGGGGGAGGNGNLGTADLLPVPAELAFFPIGSASAFKLRNFQVQVGGSAGASGNGGSVEVNNASSIITRGSNSNAIFAQSVGGGGGVGGKAGIGAFGTLGLGGEGGAAGDGGAVTVNQTGGATIETFGTASNGIFAESVGGGGGIAGNVDRALATSVNIGVGLALGRSGGGGGSGGIVDVNVNGNIITHGDSAAGIFAHSVGGGGGVLGELGNDLPVLSLLSWQIGSAGAAGDAGAVGVQLDGTIATAGNGATGIFAQSAGGGGTAGAVNVTVNGSVLTGEALAAGDENRGLGSIGILAQSAASDNANNGDIAIDISSAAGVVRGGRSLVLDADRAYTGVGVQVMDGKNNTITNRGQVMTLDGIFAGFAILATGSDATHLGGNETVFNYGTVTGNVDLGVGANAFNNMQGGLVNAGGFIRLGPGNLLRNSGTFSPGGARTVFTTALTGNYVQANTGAYAVDVDFPNAVSDRLNIAGAADLAGQVQVTVLNPGRLRQGANYVTILSASDGVTNSGLTLNATQTLVVNYSLLYPNVNDVAIGYTANFMPADLNHNQTVIGKHIGKIQSAGGSDGFDPIVAGFLSFTDIGQLASAYDRLSPEPFIAIETETVWLSRQFSDAMMSCRVRDGEYRFAREGECGWMRATATGMDRERTYAYLGYDRYTYSLAGGFQTSLGGNWRGGLALSYDHSEIDADEHAETAGEQVQVGAVVKGRTGGTTYGFAVSGGYGWFETTRSVDLPSDGVTAKSDQKLGFAAGYLRVAHDFDQGSWYLRPMINAAATYVRLSGFDEHGAGAANLEVKSTDETFFNVQPALEIGGEFSSGGTLLRPYARVGLTHFFSGTSPEIAATFEGAPSGAGSFAVMGMMDRNYIEASLGVDLLTAGGTNLRLAYTGNFSDDSKLNSLSLKISIPF